MPIENAWTWILILGLSAIAFFGYHFVKRAEEAESRRVLLPESKEEARVRYRAAWRRYRRLRIEFPLLIPGWFVFSLSLGGLFRLLGWNQDVVMVFSLAYILVYGSVVAIQWNYWKCPRCGKEFKSGYDLFFPKSCHNCGLTMWAESPDG